MNIYNHIGLFLLCEFVCILVELYSMYIKKNSDLKGAEHVYIPLMGGALIFILFEIGRFILILLTYDT